MKLKLFILPIILLIALWFFFSGTYLYLDESELAVQPSPEGNPALVINDEMYFVRYWTLPPGCYKLTRISFLDYNTATQTDESRCSVQAMSN